MPLFHALTELLGELRPEAAQSILHCIDATLQSSAVAQCIPSITQVLIHTGLLSKLCQLVLEQKDMGYILAAYLGIIGRVTLYDPLFVVEFCDRSGGILFQLVDQWIDKVSRSKFRVISF